MLLRIVGFHFACNLCHHIITSCSTIGSTNIVHLSNNMRPLAVGDTSSTYIHRLLCDEESTCTPPCLRPHSTSVATRLMCVLCLRVLAPRAHLPDYLLPSLLDHSCDHHCPLLGVPCCVPLAADCRSQAGNTLYAFLSPRQYGTSG